ncbi:MAG: cyclic nucleotide-binding domain-containing protein [Deltaproteobacteria bacterium]|nr:cyclic nucleotide-binding domain-containing protein [Deltaproteobacteria bacterium]
MNTSTYPSKHALDVDDLMQAFQKACQKDGSFSGMSLQILKDILCEPELDVIPKYLTWGTVPSGSFLWREGDSDNTLALIVSGQVSLMKETGFKDRRIVVGVYNPITLVGEISFIDGHQRALTAKATQDTEMFLLSRKNFEKLVGDYPHLGKKVIRGLLYLFSTRQRTLLERMSAVL